jgi:hypothetical protein
VEEAVTALGSTSVRLLIENPRADHPIAVEFPGYPVVRLRPIEGLEFVKEAVIALGSSTELATHLFRECWAEGTGSGADP